MICFHKRSIAKLATAVKTIFEIFFIKDEIKMSKLLIFFLVRILIFKLYFISISDNDDINMFD